MDYLKPPARCRHRWGDAYQHGTVRELIVKPDCEGGVKVDARVAYAPPWGAGYEGVVDAAILEPRDDDAEHIAITIVRPDAAARTAGQRTSAPSPRSNWTDVRFGATSLPRVTDVTVSRECERIEFVNGNDRCPAMTANSIGGPWCSINSRDVATLLGIAPGTSGTISAIWNDPARWGGGSFCWTMSNSVHQAIQWGYDATATATFRAHASDGATNPLALSRPPTRPVEASEPAVDALLIPEAKARGRTCAERMHAILAIAEAILGVDPARGERAYIRRQGDGQIFASRDAADTLYFPLDGPRRGQPRYRWTEGADGIRLGRLAPGAAQQR